MIVSISVALILTMLVSWAFHSKATDPYSEWGKLYGESMETGESDYTITGKDFKITTKEFDNMVAQYRINNDVKEAEQSAYSYYIISRSLYYEAVKEGYKATEDEVRHQIEKDRDNFAEAENYSDFQKFISATNMTEDEYWDSMENTYRLTMTIQHYTEHIQEAYLEDGNDPSDIATWQSYCFNITQDAVDAQDISLKRSNVWILTEDNYNRPGYWPNTPT